MKHSNWPLEDLSHPNHTLKTPRVSKYDGMGAYAPNSTKIPLSGWIGGIAFVAGMVALLYIGAAAGFQ